MEGIADLYITIDWMIYKEKVYLIFLELSNSKINIKDPRKGPIMLGNIVVSFLINMDILALYSCLFLKYFF